jgi:formylglycine-generating enzyme required for sulfatase activity
LGLGDNGTGSQLAKGGSAVAGLKAEALQSEQPVGGDGGARLPRIPVTLALRLGSSGCRKELNLLNPMNTKIPKLVRVLTGLTFLSLAVAVPTCAQTPPTLEIRTHAGLVITGEVGTVYAIQSTADLAQAKDWTSLEFLRLPTSDHLWVDPSPAESGRRYYRAVALAPTNLVYIPPGTFRMGSPEDEADRNNDEGPQTVVTLTRGFFMGKYPVTQEEYLAVVGNNPSHFTEANGFPADLTRPVERVGWNDATNYCAKRTEQELAAGLIPAGSQYRLPTEAEWEYACRALTSTRFDYGDDPDYANLGEFAWYADNSQGMTHPVGLKPPNHWGLYDMYGNVINWCQDRYGPLPGGSVIDPQGPASGSNRVLRGGTWVDDGTVSRIAFRGWDPPSSRDRAYGIRVVLSPRRP